MQRLPPATHCPVTPTGPVSSRGFSDLIVCGASVEARQELPRLRGNDGDFIVVARKRPHRIQGIEPHDRHELCPIINVPTDWSHLRGLIPFSGFMQAAESFSGQRTPVGVGRGLFELLRTRDADQRGRDLGLADGKADGRFDEAPDGAVLHKESQQALASRRWG